MDADKDLLKAWRLASQKLGSRRGQTPEEVVAWLCGVQAQDYRWGKWSIGLRTEGCNEEAVERAIQERQIVRMWLLRGTLFFVAANDLGWLRTLLAPGIIRGNARRYRELELDEAAFSKSKLVIQHALEENGPLTRAELKAHLVGEGVPAEGQQVPYLLQRAALDGLICHGAMRGSEPTFALVSDWVGQQGSFDRAEALGRLAVRYFTSHAPATRQDFAWWSGLTSQEASLAVEATSQLAQVEMDGVRYLVAGEPPNGNGPESGGLLPPFDEYLLGYKERSLVLDPAHMKQVNAGGGMLQPTLMLNGEILGIWSYKVTKRGMLISIQPFRELDSREHYLVEQVARRLGSFKSVFIEVSFASGQFD